MIWWIALYGFINDEINNKLLMGLGGFVIGSRECWLTVQLVIGDFSLMIHYGVRVKGFSCVWLGLRVARSIGSGLRVRSPDDHVMLLIPLYLTGVFSLFSFPHPLFPSHHWLLNHPTTSQSQNNYPLCSVCWWHDGRASHPECPCAVGRFLSLWLIWQVILIEPLIESYLWLHWAWLLPPWWEGWWD